MLVLFASIIYYHPIEILMEIFFGFVMTILLCITVDMTNAQGEVDNGICFIICR